MPFWLTPTLWVLATPFDIRVRYTSPPLPPSPPPIALLPEVAHARLDGGTGALLDHLISSK